jgi:hypothetical protein
MPLKPVWPQEEPENGIDREKINIFLKQKIKGVEEPLEGAHTGPKRGCKKSALGSLP